MSLGSPGDGDQSPKRRGGTGRGKEGPGEMGAQAFVGELQGGTAGAGLGHSTGNALGGQGALPQPSH